MHRLPCLNPHCSSSQSVPALTLFINTIRYILPTTLNKLIILELLYSHYTCNTPVRRYYPHITICRSNTAIPRFFQHYTGNSSSPGALPDFISFTTFLTSSIDIAHLLPFLLPLSILLIYCLSYFHYRYCSFTAFLTSTIDIAHLLPFLLPLSILLIYCLSYFHYRYCSPSSLVCFKFVNSPDVLFLTRLLPGYVICIQFVQ